MSAVDWSLTSKRTVAAANTDVSDSEDKLNRNPLLLLVTRAICQTGTYPRMTSLTRSSEEANYREMMRGMRYFMGWHQISDFDSSSSL